MPRPRSSTGREGFPRRGFTLRGMVVRYVVAGGLRNEGRVPNVGALPGRVGAPRRGLFRVVIFSRNTLPEAGSDDAHSRPRSRVAALPEGGRLGMTRTLACFRPKSPIR